MPRKKSKANEDNRSPETNELINLWKNLLTDPSGPFIAQIEAQKDKAPVVELTIDLKEFKEKYPTEFKTLIEKAADSIDIMKEVLTNTRPDAPIYGFENVWILIEDFPDHENIIPKKRIRELRAEDIGKMILFDGLVKKASEVFPKMELVALDCPVCGACNYAVQDGGTEYTEGVRCAFCGEARESLVRREDKSVFVNFMKCEIEEDPESLKGKQPERTLCEVSGTLTNENKRINIGNRATILGVYRVREKAKNSLMYQGYIDILGVVKRGKNYEDFKVTPEEEKKFLDMSKDPNLLAKLSASIAPNIYGHDIEKSAILLQIIGGNMEAGDRRGDIHILLIGDAGVGKSKMVRNIADIAPHVVKASGAPTTTVGLTACTVKDEDTPGGFILEAGAAVLADGGLLCIDEFDKMDKETRGAMHEIMED